MSILTFVLYLTLILGNQWSTIIRFLRPPIIYIYNNTKGILTKLLTNTHWDLFWSMDIRCQYCSSESYLVLFYSIAMYYFVFKCLSLLTFYNSQMSQSRGAVKNFKMDADTPLSKNCQMTNSICLTSGVPQSHCSSLSIIPLPQTSLTG